MFENSYFVKASCEEKLYACVGLATSRYDYEYLVMAVFFGVLLGVVLYHLILPLLKKEVIE